MCIRDRAQPPQVERGILVGHRRRQDVPGGRRRQFAVGHKDDETELGVEAEHPGDREAVDNRCGDQAAQRRRRRVFGVPVNNKPSLERVDRPRCRRCSYRDSCRRPEPPGHGDLGAHVHLQPVMARGPASNLCRKVRLAAGELSTLPFRHDQQPSRCLLYTSSHHFMCTLTHGV